MIDFTVCLPCRKILLRFDDFLSFAKMTKIMGAYWVIFKSWQRKSRVPTVWLKVASDGVR